jgi:hypothetical protein
MEITQNEINDSIFICLKCASVEEKKSILKICKTCQKTKHKINDYYVKNQNASCKECIREKNKKAYKIYYQNNKREHRQHGLKRLFDEKCHLKSIEQ